MTSDRAYRTALPHKCAVEEIYNCSNTQFDPKMTELFVGISDEIEKIKLNPEEAYLKYSYLNKFMH